MNWMTSSFIVIISLFLLKSTRGDQDSLYDLYDLTCERCDPAKITNTYASCGVGPWCLHDASCLNSQLADPCWCNRYSSDTECPIGDKCTDTEAGGGEVCAGCEPCYEDDKYFFAQETGHPEFRTKCYQDCDGNCVYQRMSTAIEYNLGPRITDCINTGTRRKVNCKAAGLSLRLPHKCQCIPDECNGPYCNPLTDVISLLEQELYFPADDLCDNDEICCCSCPNCNDFAGWPSI